MVVVSSDECRCVVLLLLLLMLLLLGWSVNPSKSQLKEKEK